MIATLTQKKLTKNVLASETHFPTFENSSASSSNMRAKATAPWKKLPAQKPPSSCLTQTRPLSRLRPTISSFRDFPEINSSTSTRSS